jgi:hypothetical protein
MAILLNTNVTSILNVTGNIANTGNLLVTQNSFTGNLSVTTLANMASMNISSTIVATGSPLTNTVTRVMTGVSNNLTAQVAMSATLTSTNVLSCTLNEAGMYAMQGMIFLGGNNGSNVVNSGMNIGFAGSVTINKIQYALVGRSNGVTITTNLITTGAQTIIIAKGTQLSNSTNGTDYLIINGYMNVTSGNINVQFATPNTINCSANVMSNSYILYEKIA